MKITKATQKDLDECAKMSHIREFSFTYKASDSRVKKYLNDFLKKGILLVAKENDNLIGFLAAEFTLGKFIWVDFLVVDKKYRRKGFGKILFNKMEQIAKKKGFNNIFLIVPKFNKNSIKFYKSLYMKKGNECIEFYKEI